VAIENGQIFNSLFAKSGGDVGALGLQKRDLASRFNHMRHLA
jgi:hypothetical protein